MSSTSNLATISEDNSDESSISDSNKDDTILNVHKKHTTGIKIKVNLKDVKITDISSSLSSKSSVSRNNLDLECVDVIKVKSPRKKKINQIDSDSFITNDDSIALSRHDLTCNSVVMNEVKDMDGKRSFESVSSSNNSEDPLNISNESEKIGRKKLLKITGDKSNKINNKDNEISNLVSTSNKTVVMNRSIKSEPVDDEIFHMSCDEVSLNETSEGTTPQVKRKRGRPKKNQNDSRNNGDKSDKGSSDEGKKAFKKIENDEVKSTCSASSGDKLPIKRGRGRPRKSDTDSINKSAGFGDCNSGDSGSRSSIRVARRSILSERKRRIVKPKRFDSFESFDFMDVNDKHSCISNETSVGDNEDDFNGSDILQTDVRDDEDEEDEGEEKKQKPYGGGDARPKIIRKKRRIEVKPLAPGRDGDCEFDAFGKNVALQLKKLSLQDALELQIQILSLISERRLSSVMKT